MHGTLRGRIIAANAALATDCQRWQDSAEPLWFAQMCRELWGANAPKELEFALKRNGLDRSDRTCRAWASGDSPPPVNILLVLLHDAEVGKRVLDYVMRDCDAPWWREHQRAERIAAQVDKLDLT
jgi:hypothetical protein